MSSHLVKTFAPWYTFMIWMWQPTPNLARSDVCICSNCSNSLIPSTPTSWQLHICLQKRVFSTFCWPHAWYLAHVILRMFKFSLQVSDLRTCPFSSKVSSCQFWVVFFYFFLFVLLVSWICFRFLFSKEHVWNGEKKGGDNFHLPSISSLFQTLAMQVCTEKSKKKPELSS